MPTIKYPNNPNVETAFVEQDDGTKNRVVLTAAQDISTIEYPNNPNSTKAYITVNGKKQRVVMTADIAGGGGGGGAVSSVNGKTGAVVLTASDVLPDQTGQSGKFLTTDGTDASWSDKPLANTATGTNSVGVLGTASQDTSVVVGINATTGVSGSAKVAIGNTASATGNGAIAIGQNTTASGLESIAIGQGAKATGAGAVQIKYGTNSTADTIQFGSYTLVSADGTIPEARLADTTNAQQGDVLTLDANGDAVWQAGGGGSSYTAGTGIDITNGTISVTSPTLTNQATGTDSISIGAATNAKEGVSIGSGATLGAAYVRGAVSIGYLSSSTSAMSIAIGNGAKATAIRCIQLGYGTNSDANTFKIANENGNFEMMSADGTIPAARHASLPSADGTYVLKLVISGGVPTLSWVAE